ncbi:MAG: 50S ribosomal protein L18 [Candidatus Coatesbacteria bacterium]|nr:50S ribosomal protein L18 [Candidatus Coatesbacteria bacterium]
MRRKFRSKKAEARFRRHLSVRKAISGTKARPRLCVFRSLRELYGSLIDDETGHTLFSESTLSLRKNGALKGGGNKDAAKAAGVSLAKKAIENGIESVVFDRAGYKYHGRVRAFSEGAREAGLRF